MRIDIQNKNAPPYADLKMITSTKVGRYKVFQLLNEYLVLFGDSLTISE